MKILFVRINDKIGDTVIETFFYRELKKLFPHAHLTVMCCGNKELLQTVSYIDELILLPPGGFHKIMAAFAKIPSLWKQRYDLLISLTPHWRMKFFNSLVPAQRKECFDYQTQGEHISVAYARVLQRLGKKQIDTTYELHIPDEMQKLTDCFLKKNGLSENRFLVFNPQGGDPNRTLNACQTQQVLENLRGIAIVLLDLYHSYPTHLPHVVPWHCADIFQTAALIKRAAYVLTVDTVVAHIAETFEKPMTVLFSLKNYTNEPAKDISLLTTWGPRGNRVRKLWAKNSVNQIPVTDIIRQIDLPIK